MTKYILKRILIAIPTLLGITIIDYAIMCFAGSPLEMLQGARISQEAIAAKEAAMGLDKPFYIQYFIWLGQLLSGNMGYSVKSYEAVSAMIGSHLGPTLLLMGVSSVSYTHLDLLMKFRRCTKLTTTSSSSRLILYARMK